jgi:uncharacterized membrane protein
MKRSQSAVSRAVRRIARASEPGESPARPNALGRRAPRIVLALILAHVGVMTAIVATKFSHDLYTDFDLAIFAHATAQLARGSLFESIGGMNWLGGHVAPVLFLLVPLWLVAPSALTLLVVQNVALAGAAWPLFRLARRELGSDTAALACAAVWLLQPALGYVALFEFHPETLAVPALVFAIDALRARRLRALVAWSAFALLAREDVALVVLGLAGYALVLRPRRQAAAAWLAGLGVVSLVLSFALVMPAFGSGQADYATMYSRWGHSIREVLANVARAPWRALTELFSTPGDAADSTLKQLWYVYVLFPFAFLSLASALVVVPLPILVEHFLSSRMSAHSIVFHYAALVLPFVAASAVVGMGAVARRTRLQPAMLAGVVLACALASQFLYGPFGGAGLLRGIAMPQSLRPNTDQRVLAPWREKLRERVPSEGGVIAGFDFLARFAARKEVHALHHFVGGHYTFSSRPYDVPRGITAVLGDLGQGSLFKHVDDGTSGRWRELLWANRLAPLASADDLVLFGPASADTVTLWSVAEPATSRERPITYDGQVAFMGADVDSTPTPPGERVTLRTYWRRAAPTDRFFLTEMVVVGPDGQAARGLWRYLGYTLHPVAEWPEGASVCETYRLVVPPASAPGRYTIGARLWWRRDGQGVCVADDPRTQADQGFVTLGAFNVAPAR